MKKSPFQKNISFQFDRSFFKEILGVLFNPHQSFDITQPTPQEELFRAVTQQDADKVKFFYQKRILLMMTPAWMS